MLCRVRTLGIDVRSCKIGSCKYLLTKIDAKQEVMVTDASSTEINTSPYKNGSSFVMIDGGKHDENNANLSRKSSSRKINERFLKPRRKCQYHKLDARKQR